MFRDRLVADEFFRPLAEIFRRSWIDEENSCPSRFELVGFSQQLTYLSVANRTLIPRISASSPEMNVPFTSRYSTSIVAYHLGPDSRRHLHNHFRATETRQIHVERFHAATSTSFIPVKKELAGPPKRTAPPDSISCVLVTILSGGCHSH